MDGINAGTRSERSAVPGTEARNPLSLRIDEMSTLDILTLINDEDSTVAAIVREALPAMADAVEAMRRAFELGGSIHYVGAGTSGRMAVLDAAEVVPTYGIADDRIVAHIAGGRSAITTAIEGAEDSEDAGRALVAALREHDVVVGIAASGSTPFVLGAIEAGHARGLTTIALSSNDDAVIARSADHRIVVATGPEVITGSTRMKAATAQKLVLQAMSTALMIRLGRTRSNLMLGLRPANAKLRARAAAMLTQLSPGDNREAVAAIAEADGDLFRALDLLRARAAPRNIREDRPGFVLGIDIGGTGIRARLLDHSGEERHDRGHFVCHATDEWDSLLPQKALGELASWCASVLSGDDGDSGLQSIGVGLAGAVHRPERCRAVLIDLTRVFGAVPIDIFADSTAAYVAAKGTRAGALLTVGTGSVAIGTDAQNEWRRIDGLGLFGGDYGSGAWIGERACRRVLDAAAGRATPVEAMAEAFRERFGSVGGYLNEISATHNPGTVFASFAAPIIALGANGDPESAALCAHAADELVVTARAAALNISTEITATGGVLSAESSLLEIFSERAGRAGLTVVQATTPTAIGAARFALLARSRQLPRVFREQLILSNQSSVSTEGDQ